jgi:hypothetical protein
MASLKGVAGWLLYDLKKDTNGKDWPLGFALGAKACIIRTMYVSALNDSV